MVSSQRGDYMFELPDSRDLISFANELCGRHFHPGIDNVSAQNNLNDIILNSCVIQERKGSSQSA